MRDAIMRLFGLLALIFFTQRFVSCRIRPPYCQKLTTEVKQPSQFLWKIRRNPPAYFFGTIHMSYVEVWDYLSPEMKSAFYQTQNVIMELDLSDFYTLKLLHRCRLLPEGKELSHFLPKDIYQRLKNHMDYVRMQMPSWLGSDDPVHARAHANYIFETIAGSWENRRPIWAMFMLNSLTEDSVMQFGSATLDSYLIQEAKRRSQNVGAIEYVTEHCHALNSLSLSQAIFALNLTLTMHEQLRWGLGHNDELSARTQLIRHYNCGTLDEEVFDKEILNVLETTAPDPAAKTRARDVDSYFKKELVYKRNLRMAERVLKVLDSKPDQSFFFAFGTGHFLGENSVIDLVEQAGLLVEPVLMDPNKRGQRKKGREKSRHGSGVSQVSGNNFSWRWASRNHRVRSEGWPPTTEKPKERIFNPLWVPIKNYSPKPWQEINLEPYTPESAASKVDFNQYETLVVQRGNSASKLFPTSWIPRIFAIMLMLMTVFVFGLP